MADRSITDEDLPSSCGSVQPGRAHIDLCFSLIYFLIK